MDYYIQMVVESRLEFIHNEKHNSNSKNQHKMNTQINPLEIPLKGTAKLFQLCNQ